MEPKKLAHLMRVVRAWAMHTGQSPIHVAEGLCLMTAALAIGLGVSREDFVRDAGTAYDDAKKRAGGGSLLLGSDGLPIV